MKKLQLVKSAIDFAFAHYQDDAVTFTIESANAFKAAGGDVADFTIWQQAVMQSASQAAMLVRQILPSEAKSARAAKPVVPTSNVAAVTNKPE